MQRYWLLPRPMVDKARHNMHVVESTQKERENLKALFKVEHYSVIVKLDWKSLFNKVARVLRISCFWTFWYFTITRVVNDRHFYNNTNNYCFLYCLNKLITFKHLYKYRQLLTYYLLHTRTFSLNDPYIGQRSFCFYFFLYVDD